MNSVKKNVQLKRTYVLKKSKILPIKKYLVLCAPFRFY